MAEIFGDEVAFDEHIGADKVHDIENKRSEGSNASDVQKVEVLLSEK
jgi:hypothetical protein